MSGLYRNTESKLSKVVLREGRLWGEGYQVCIPGYRKGKVLVSVLLP